MTVMCINKINNKSAFVLCFVFCLLLGFIYHQIYLIINQGLRDVLYYSSSENDIQIYPKLNVFSFLFVFYRMNYILWCLSPTFLQGGPTFESYTKTY